MTSHTFAIETYLRSAERRVTFALRADGMVAVADRHTGAVLGVAHAAELPVVDRPKPTSFLLMVVLWLVALVIATGVIAAAIMTVRAIG